MKTKFRKIKSALFFVAFVSAVSVLCGCMTYSQAYQDTKRQKMGSLGVMVGSQNTQGTANSQHSK